MKKIILFGVVFICCLQFNFAQHPGDLDSSFGTNGIVTLDLGPSTYLTQSAIQNNGKILVSGYTYLNEQYHFFLMRYNKDGSIDNSFGQGGFNYIDFGIASLVIQNDGKIIAAGGLLLVRYNTDGSVDNSFGENGIQHNDFGISSLAIQSDGKIVVAGSIGINDEYGLLKPALARYNTNGRIDSSFSEDGKQTTEFENSDYLTASVKLLAIQSDGKIVISGNKFEFEAEFPYGGYIARYNNDGSPDKQINIGRGIGVQGSVAMGSNNEIAITGNMSNREGRTVALLTFDTNDWSSHYSDVTYIGWDFYKVSIESNGKIIMTGDVIARFNAHGGLDSSFSEDGIQTNRTGILYETTTVIAENKLYVLGENIIATYVLEEDIKTSRTIKITSPVEGATYTANATIILSTEASDEDGTVKTVSFYNGDKLIFTELAPPFYRKWFNVKQGSYTITAKAIDNDGNVTVSAPVHITVLSSSSPSVNITRPLNESNYGAGTDIVLSADAFAPGIGIRRVDFYSGNDIVLTEYKAPYYNKWRNVSAGSYSIVANATDSNGNVISSQPVQIIVTGPLARPIVKEDKQSFSERLFRLNVNPNPVSNVLNISIDGLQNNDNSSISIISSSGALIKTIQTKAIDKNIQLNVSSLSTGVYTIKFVHRGVTVCKKFVKL
jgi:uncharacterized delta-60 repeat protein